MYIEIKNRSGNTIISGDYPDMIAALVANKKKSHGRISTVLTSVRPISAEQTVVV